MRCNCHLSLSRHHFLTAFFNPPLKVLSSLPEMADQLGPSHFRDIFDTALRTYEKVTGVALTSHPLAMGLQDCDNIEGITVLLQDQAKDLRKSEKITKSVETIVSILTPLSSAASFPDTVGLVRQKVLVANFRYLTVSYSLFHPQEQYTLVSVSYLTYVPSPVYIWIFL